MSEEYVCTNPPCIHVVIDHRKKIFAVFIETADEDYIYIPVERILEASDKARELLRKHYREAKDTEIDQLASEKLGAIPIEEE